MPAFRKPGFAFDYDSELECSVLRRYSEKAPSRTIPPKSNECVLFASWNIANLGLQKRREKDYRLIAEIISWFDFVAVQEVNDNLIGLRSVMAQLTPHHAMLFSDKSGNDERMAFIYDTSKLSLMEKVGEISIPASEHKHIKLKGTTQPFKGFDRNPYFAAFKAANTTLLFVNAHLYFGSNSKKDVEKRSLEAYAIARWADLRTKDKHAYTKNIIVLGDLNLPKADKSDPVFKTLRSKGLMLPDHSSQIASALSTDNYYDQIMFSPCAVKKLYTGKRGVFDYDGVIFKDLWQTKTKKQFESYCRYYISDHRPVWAELKIT